MVDERPFLTRLRGVFVPALLGVVLAVLVGLSVRQYLVLRGQIDEAVRQQLEGQLQDRVSAWEDALVQELAGFLDAAGQDPAASWATELDLRAREPWVDSLYLWRPRREARWRGRVVTEPADFLYPLPPPDELDGPDGAYNRNACLPPMGLEGEDPAEAAAGLVAGCALQPRSVRMLAATRASTLLTEAGDDAGALEVLDSAIDPLTSLRAGIQQGIDPYRLFMHRHQRAEILDRLGHRDEALELLLGSGLEACELAAPEYAKVRGWLDFAVRKPLRAAAKTDGVRRLSEAIARAERRYRAYEEIGQRVLPQPPLQASREPRFIFDQYSPTPFVVFYGPSRGGEIGVGVQVDQPLLLADLLNSLKRYRATIVVTDSRGDWVAGARSGGPVAVEIPFMHTLTHLRVGLREQAVIERSVALQGQWQVPLGIVSTLALIGVLAIVALVRADREQNRLIQRQRDFTARVTHELKTPLAGIKVMAENLESGAFVDDEARAEMARSIGREADRLHRRVEEVLAVAKAKTVPDPAKFDLEGAVQEAIEVWGPRLERGGVKLTADLDVTDPVLGDPAAVRDAVGCLLDNALKYHDERRAEPQVWIVLRQADRHAEIDISDNGLGVPEDMRAAIFQRFVRVEGPHRGKAGGHGLGLAQVAEIVAEHGGTVTCSEGVDGGARFVIHLPTLPQPAR